jgi:hypothetical protein
MMPYVTDMNSKELRAHIKTLKAMNGWNDPFVDRLFKEINKLDEALLIATEGSTMTECKGKSCKAVDGVGHSDECQQEHSDTVNNIPMAETASSCFDRAEHNASFFDNCRFFQVCKDAKPICGNDPEAW